MLIRLPQVHDTRNQGRITQHIQLARQHGRVAYVGEGQNRALFGATQKPTCELRAAVFKVLALQGSRGGFSKAFRF